MLRKNFAAGGSQTRDSPTKRYYSTRAFHYWTKAALREKRRQWVYKPLSIHVNTYIIHILWYAFLVVCL